MDEEGDSPQFWLHSALTGDSTRRKSSSNNFNSTFFMLIVAIPALLLLLFAFSSFPILKPDSVRKSWDSINALLVLFAIVCGVFARWNEDVESNTNKELEIFVEEVSSEVPLQQTSTPTSSYELRWYEFPYESHMSSIANGGLRRNGSSYPDLRHQSDWETTSDHEFRYYDDFEISRFNQSVEEQPNGTVSGRGITRRNGDLDEKVISVDTYPTQPDSKAKSLQDNPPSQPPHPTQQKKTRVHRSVPKRERSGMENAPRFAPRQQPQKEDKGSSTLNPIKNGLTSQTKPRRRKVHKDVPVKDETVPRPASESSPIRPISLPQVHLTIPMEEEYIKPTDEIISPCIPPEHPKLTRTLQKQEIETSTETKASQSHSPPPPPPTPIRPDQNQKSIKKDKKKSSAKKEIAMVWASIYKRKKQNQPQQHHQQQQLGRADSGNYNGISLLFSEPEYTSSSQLSPPPSPAPPPPPPPRPPPHSVFHSLFKKYENSKSKKIHSVAAPSPPPPPPPPRQSINSSCNSPQQRASTGGKPPLPKRPSSYSKSEYGGYLNNSGSQSPLFDVPHPPPLPPFGVPDTKFVVRGGYAKIKSNASSRSGSPEPYVFDDDDESLINESDNGGAGRTITTPYCPCPSPDVNAKADTFIARLRGEWRLEKMNEKSTRVGI